jgi:hypothetical protein
MKYKITKDIPDPTDSRLLLAKKGELAEPATVPIDLDPGEVGATLHGNTFVLRPDEYEEYHAP